MSTFLFKNNLSIFLTLLQANDQKNVRNLNFRDNGKYEQGFRLTGRSLKIMPTVLKLDINAIFFIRNSVAS